MKKTTQNKKHAYPLVFWAEGETFSMILATIEIAKLLRGKWLLTARKNEAALECAKALGFKACAESLDAMESSVKDALKAFPKPIRDMARRRADEWVYGNKEASK